MNKLSLKYLNCHWAKELEYLLCLQLSGLRFQGFISINTEEENTLRQLSQLNGGWFYWDKDKAQPIFLSWASWFHKYDEWHFKNITFRAKLETKQGAEPSGEASA
jgi:hypothetical protein